MKNKHPKPGYLGPAFHEWLEWLEYVECVLTTHRHPGKPKYMAVNDRLFTVGDDMSEMMNDLMPVDAYLARVVRSSVKYRVDASVLFDMNDRYGKEMEYIFNTRPIHLPHEWCTLVIENVRQPGDHLLVCAQETLPSTKKHSEPCYPDLGIHGDEKFIDCNLALVRQGGVTGMNNKVITSQHLSTVPVELHFNKGKTYNETTFLNAIAAGVKPTTDGALFIELCRHLIMQWIYSFHLAGILRHKSIGVAPQMKLYGRTKRRKKSAHPAFEHIVVELPIDDPEAQQTGRHVFQPHKRLHQVRGFMRHYKSGKTTWVKPHWRGDEKLGVIRRDFEMTLNEEETA